MKTLENIRKHKRGLSLVELMVVLAIMSILAAVAIPSYLSYQKNARDAVVESMLHLIDKTIAFEIARDWPLSKLGEPGGLDEVWDEVRSSDREYFTKPVMNVGTADTQQWCLRIGGKSGTDYDGYSGCVSNNTATPNKVLHVAGGEKNCTDAKAFEYLQPRSSTLWLCPTGCFSSSADNSISSDPPIGNCRNGSATTYKSSTFCVTGECNII